MIARIRLLSSFLLALTFLFFAGSGAAQDVSPRCEAAIDRAAGTYSRCLLGAQTRNALSSNASRLESAEQRCADRFDAATARALARAEQREETCTPLLVEIADRTVSNAENVAKEARGEPAPAYLYVQDAKGATLTNSELVLSGVNGNTGWFMERPYRHSGQLTTEAFVELFSDTGPSSFAADPPNADLNCEVDGQVVNLVVVLQSPMRIQVGEDTWDLQYSVTPTVNSLVPDTMTCDANAHVFIDGEPSANSDGPKCWEKEKICIMGGVCGSLGRKQGPYAEATAASLGCEGDTLWHSAAQWESTFPANACSLPKCPPKDDFYNLPVFCKLNPTGPEHDEYCEKQSSD